MPTYKDFIKYLFFSLISGICAVGVNYTRDISKQLTDLAKMQSESNTRMEVLTTAFMDQKEVVIEKVRDHETRLRKIELSTIK